MALRIKEKNTASPSRVLEKILEEVRLLRKELSLLFPQEDLKDYAHPSRIKSSYKKAVKLYPPLSV